LFLLGTLFFVGAISNAIGNVALGNPLSGGLLYMVLAFGIVGAVMMSGGVFLYFRGSESPKA
jgi:hypothetical protein